MESYILISLSEYIDPDHSQRFDHSGRNEIWREPFPLARACDTGATNVKVGPPPPCDLSQHERQCPRGWVIGLRVTRHPSHALARSFIIMSIFGE